ncbi:hypothetical protein R3X26_18460 [Vibrio sp. TH_r3]|uniref:hypothetical protein n=1 Tax=Vibrio sp. TH_r3 TaxID=3082084 RepID=UPI0029559747|nr:hypothetical protein [Vibrio sp. TH_r3]MDV7106369.1 hypothetical protein [Vibrio sp. TH_r3]
MSGKNASIFDILTGLREKIANEDNDGIKLDGLSCLISLALSVEALVNFVGHKEVDKWKEFDQYIK